MLRGQHALVTGAARGIGAEIAHVLAAEGANVTLLGRSIESLARVLHDLRGLAVSEANPSIREHGAVAADVTDPQQVQAAFAQATTERGPITILINNAGQAESAPFGKTSVDLWNRMLAVNLTGTFLCSQAALPGMLAAGRGRIVNIASTAGQRGYAYVSAYVAAKHGVIGLTRSLALEVAKKGVTVNAVCPGYTETDILRDSIANVVAKTGRSEADARAAFAASNPQERIVQPEQVADAVRWLCGDAAAAVTGQAISVSGGEVM
jgi:NAD(P)-dependent dehydrogenase (short-subunit alcohol dehydrogenase family)